MPSEKESSDARPFEHRCDNGTIFTAARRDFGGGVVAKCRKGLPIERLMQDVGQMVGFHATRIFPELESFCGYDCVKYTIEEAE